MSYDDYSYYQSQKLNIEREKQFMQQRMNEARQEQAERHHADMISFQNQRAKIQQQLEQDKTDGRIEEAKITAAANTQAVHIQGQYGLENTRMNNQALSILEGIRGKNQLDSDYLRGSMTMKTEEIRGGNERGLAIIEYALEQSGKASDNIDEMIQSELRKSEKWDADYSNMLLQLLTIKANTIAQVQLKQLDHSHEMEKSKHLAKVEKKIIKLKDRHEKEKRVLDQNFQILERHLAHHLQNLRVSYDKACEIIFRLVERMLGLGDQQVSEGDISQYVREAMAAAQGGGY